MLMDFAVFVHLTTWLHIAFQLFCEQFHKFVFVQPFDAVNQRDLFVWLYSLTDHEFQDILQDTKLDAIGIFFVSVFGIAAKDLFQVPALLYKTSKTHQLLLH